jgi:putative pyoverdin transport system ATP-binding/permease protein
MSVVVFLLARSWRRMAMAVLLSGLTGVVSILLIAMINRLEHSGVSAADGGHYLALCLVRLVTGTISGAILIRLTQNTIRDLRVQLSDQIMQAPLRHIEVQGPHRFFTCLSDDLGDLAATVINLPYFLVNIIVIMSSLVYLGWLSPGILLLFIACLAVGVLTYIIPVRVAKQHFRTARKSQDELFRHLRSVVDGAQELKLSHARRADFLHNQLTPTAESLRDNNVRAATIYTTTANWNRLLFFIYVGIILFIIPRFSSTNPGLSTAYILTVLYLMAPLEAIMNSLPNMARAGVALTRIKELGLSLDRVKELPRSETVERLPGDWSEIRLEQVCFDYQVSDGSMSGPDRFYIGPLSLVVRRGEMLFIIGGNGSGKTTLAKLLTGLYTPTAGQVFLQNTEIDDARRPLFRELFSCVFSNFYLSSHIVSDDIADLDRRCKPILRLLELDNKLTISGGKFSTTNLSQGQRKRLALLVALMEDRPVLVFDEWAADQDPEFREYFYCQVLPDLRAAGKAVVVVTHDDRYFRLADRLIKLERGLAVQSALPPATPARALAAGSNCSELAADGTAPLINS